MNTNPNEPLPLDGWQFSININQIPTEEMLKHAGKHIAYSWDGTCILASGADEDEVDRELIAAGIDPSRVVHSYVPGPDEHTLL